MKYTKTDAVLSLYPGVNTFERSEADVITFRKEDAKNPTNSQIDAEVIRLNNAEAGRLLRVERNKKLVDSDWRASNDLTISDAWKTYRQQLRDLPASTTPTLTAGYTLDPTSVTWPEEPS
tara:strand:+ start:174 stop:533 length:360 start_codon:yes stop_codon:yes gene_type:complete